MITTTKNISCCIFLPGFMLTLLLFPRRAKYHLFLFPDRHVYRVYPLPWVSAKGWGDKSKRSHPPWKIKNKGFLHMGGFFLLM